MQLVESAFTYVIFSPMLDGEKHRHHFVQISLLAPKAKLNNLVCEQQQAYLILSDIKHQITSPQNTCITILIEPTSLLANQLINYVSHQNAIEQGIYKLDKLNATLLWQWFNAKQQTQTDFIKASSQLYDSIQCQCAHSATVSDPRIMQVITTLKAANGKITLEQLAESCQLSPSRLSHLFVEQVGIAIKSYIRYQRFHRLLPLLQTNKSLTEIAFIADFSDQAHFSRECKSLFGITPKQLKHGFSLHQF